MSTSACCTMTSLAITNKLPSKGYKKISLISSKITSVPYEHRYDPNPKMNDVLPPATTNRIAINAHRLTGLRLDNRSWRDGFTGFLPARALLANCAFRWRSSNSVGYH